MDVPVLERREARPTKGSAEPLPTLRLAPRPANTRLSREWDHCGRLLWRAFLGLVILPVAAFVAIGAAEGSLVYAGNDNGLLQDPIFLAYFPSAFLLVAALWRVVDRLPRALASLGGVIRLQEGGGGPGMRRDDVARLLALYTHCYEGLTFRRRARPAPEGYGDLMRLPRIAFGLALVGGAGFLYLSTRSHLDPVAAYGFDIWSAPGRPLGLWGRFALEAFLYLVLAPVAAHHLAASMRLLQHSTATLRRQEALRFVRFSGDAAGGLGRFGEQSFNYVLVVLAFLPILVAYVVDYPVTPGLVAGAVIFVLVLPLVFFWPLLPARRVLLDAKLAELDGLAVEYNRHYARMCDTLRDGDKEDVERARERVAAAREVFEDVQAQPIWPFDTRLLARFGSVVVFVAASLFTAFLDVLGGI